MKSLATLLFLLVLAPAGILISTLDYNQFTETFMYHAAPIFGAAVVLAGLVLVLIAPEDHSS